MSRSTLVQNRQPAGMFSIEDLSLSTGRRFFVHAGSGLDATNYGESPDFPAASLSYALSLCTAGKGDIVYLMPGHAETQDVSGTLWTASKAGVRILGLGQGASRPTFTLSHTGATLAISAAGVSLENVLIVAGIDSIAVGLSITAADVLLRDVEFRDATDIEAVRWIVATAAHRLRLDHCLHAGYTAGDASESFARLIDCDTPVLRHCRMLGNYLTAAVEFHTTAALWADIDDSLFLTGLSDGSRNVVDTVGGSTWIFRDSFDLGAGEVLSGSFGVTAMSNARLGKRVTRAAADVLDGTQKALFTVSGGRVLLTHLELEVTAAAVDNTTSNLRFVSNPTVGTDANLSADLDIDSDELGSLYSLSGTPGDATTGGSGGSAPAMARPAVVPEGTIDVLTSADAGTGGALAKAELWYLPLDDGATVAAA